MRRARRGSPAAQAVRRAGDAARLRRRGGQWSAARLPAVTTNRRMPSAASTRAAGGNRPFGSRTTRAGLGPSTRRTVNCGSSAIAVPTPITTASTSARSRCRWASPALAVDVMRMPGRGGDARVDRLAALPDHHQVVDGPVPQRPEKVLPGRRQRNQLPFRNVSRHRRPRRLRAGSSGSRAITSARACQGAHRSSSITCFQSTPRRAMIFSLEDTANVAKKTR